MLEISWKVNRKKEERANATSLEFAAEITFSEF